MTLGGDSYIIVFDQLSNERREVAHELIKANANGWWHNLPNVWIVGGQTVSFWRETLHPVIASTGASILVMNLPAEPSTRSWAFYGPRGSQKAKWLYETYSGTSPPEE